MEVSNNSSSVADTAFIHKCVYEMRTHELQAVLQAVKNNKTGNKSTLRKRILNLLTATPVRTKVLRQKIVAVYKSRLQRGLDTSHLMSLPTYRQSGYQNQSQNILHQCFPHFPSNSIIPSLSNTVQFYNDPLHMSLTAAPTPSAEFEDLPFFQTKEILLNPMYCQKIDDSANFSGLFYLTDSVRHSIVKSWIIAKQEYKVQIILRFVQIGLQDDTTERLPYNITVSMNDRPCSLPTLNIPTKAGITPWRCSIPIDITQQTDLRNSLQNTLKVSWSNEPHEYMAAVYVAEKLTWCELLVDLKTRPLRNADKTKLIIKKFMENDNDMGVDSMIATIKDPLSKTKMELPARGKDCIHLQCFDAIQFLQMNEQKQTWLCPLCKKKLKFQNIEIDEFFLNVLQSPHLSDDCDNICLYEDGSWSEKKPSNHSSGSKLNSNDNLTNKHIDVITLSDSDDDDDDDVLPVKCSSPPSLEVMEIKSEHFEITEVKDPTPTKDNNSTEDGMQTDDNNPAKHTMQTDDNSSAENNLVLDLSLKNSSSPAASSDDQSVITLNDDADETPPFNETPQLFNNFNLPDVTISQNNNEDYKPSNSKKKTKNKRIEKHKDKASNVLCVITLD